MQKQRRYLIIIQKGGVKMEFRETSDAKEVEEVGNKDNTDECKLDEKNKRNLIN